MDAAQWVPGAEPPETIEHEGLTLSRWAAGDGPALLAAVDRSREHLAAFLPWAQGYCADSAAAFLGATTAGWARRREFTYRVTGDGLDGVLGSIGLMARNGPGVLEIGYWVRGDAVRRGITTRAAAAVTRAGLALPGVERIEIHHDPRNAASGGIPLHLGYVRLEGLVPGPPGREDELMVCWVLGREEFAAVRG
jgi:ribosomal-protein-serine acetyltransferase